MQIGTFLPTYWMDYGATGVRTAIVETARAAQALGYHSVWANDHVIAPTARPEMGHIIEPLTTLASVVHLVPTLQLGTSTLVLPQRDPILVAKQVAALDVLSGGRFILGVGVGWLEEEFGLLHADFAQRGAIADEAIEAIRTLWQEQEATFHGRFFEFADAVSFPKPLCGTVPIWVCGNTRAAIRRAARTGDAWNPFGIKLDAFKAGVSALQALSGDRTPTIAAHLQIRIGEHSDPRAHIAGGADTVGEVLADYREAGLAYLICDFIADGLDDLLSQMQIMAARIAPSLTATA